LTILYIVLGRTYILNNYEIIVNDMVDNVYCVLIDVLTSCLLNFLSIRQRNTMIR